jgi:hypothetical protein
MMKSWLMSSAALAVAALPLLGSPGAGGQGSSGGRQRVDVSTLGPQVGDRVPDFTLPDHAGRMRTLQSIMGPRGAMIVFYRSADW